MIREGIAITAVVIGMGAAAVGGQHRLRSGPPPATSTQAQSAPVASPTAQQRSFKYQAPALSCQEDEDIVVSLGDNGLPFAFCQQVIER